MTYGEIKRAMKGFANEYGGEYDEIYKSLVRLERTDQDSAAGLRDHLEAQGFKTADEVREYLVCEL